MRITGKRAALPQSQGAPPLAYEETAMLHGVALSAGLGVWILTWKQRNNDLGLWKTVTVLPGRLHLRCKVVASTGKRY